MTTRIPLTEAKLDQEGYNELCDKIEESERERAKLKEEVARYESFIERMIKAGVHIDPSSFDKPFLIVHTRSAMASRDDEPKVFIKGENYGV